jgi:hypothetical protein
MPFDADAIRHRPERLTDAPDQPTRIGRRIRAPGRKRRIVGHRHDEPPHIVNQLDPPSPNRLREIPLETPRKRLF